MFLFQLQLFQKIDNVADLPIHHADHGSIATGLFGPGFVFIEFPGGIVVRNIEDAVWGSDGQVAEKRLVFVFANKLLGSIDDHVMRIVGACAASLVSFVGGVLCLFSIMYGG